MVLDQEKVQLAESPDVNKRHSADLLTLEAMVETKVGAVTSFVGCYMSHVLNL